MRALYHAPALSLLIAFRVLVLLRHSQLYQLEGFHSLRRGGKLLAPTWEGAIFLHVPVVHRWENRMTGPDVSRHLVTR